MFQFIGSVTKTLTAALASILALCLLICAQDNKVAKEINDTYAKRAKAILGKDFAYLKIDEAEDYSEKSKDGSLRDRKQADDEADEVLKVVREVYEYSLKVDSIKEDSKRNEATVEISDNGRFSFLGPDGKAHEMSAKGRSRDLWKRTPRGWKIKFHEELESTIEVDGKPIN